MIIKKIAFGNIEEAFIESRLIEGVNIVYSNDNNKGKTLLIQGALFSLGNIPIFPTGFDYLDYYFYTKVEINKKEYEFLRKRSTTIIKTNGDCQIFDNLSELKYYVSKHIFELPVIKKDGEDKVVDLFLYYQLFFIGQDKRNTSNIQNNGYYGKKDFVSMLNSMNGYQQSLTYSFDVEEIRKEIQRIRSEVLVIHRKMELFKENPDVASQALKVVDREDFKRCLKNIREINGNISNFKKRRNREINRKTKLEFLLSELISLNQRIEVGKIKCSECGSDKIIYSNGDINFEVSNSVVRKNILNSIKEQINMRQDVIEELTGNVNTEQDQLSLQLRETPLDWKNILIFKEDILTEEQYSSELLKLKAKIVALESKLLLNRDESKEAKEKSKLMKESILIKMNKYYHAVDPTGVLKFDNLFTKNDENYSGSEEQEFYFSKLMAINSYFEHSFPIILDSFRSGELSTNKELIMIDYYKKIMKQVILTSTLKVEEYEKLKYKNIDEINAIDYSEHQNSQILQNSYVDEFKEILKGFGVKED